MISRTLDCTAAVRPRCTEGETDAIQSNDPCHSRPRIIVTWRNGHDDRNGNGIEPGADRGTGDHDRAGAGGTGRGFSGLDAQNPLANLYRDEFTWAPYAPTKVGNGGGNINWAANPYKNASWYMWLHSLRWLGQGIVAASNGDLAALTRVDTIAYDWYRDNPYSWKANVGAWESTMHRTNVLICPTRASRSSASG